MRTSLGKILQWVLLGVLFLGIPSALADPINTIAGGAGLDLSSPRVWRHGTAVSTDLDAGAIVPSATQYMPMVGAVLAACNSTAACGGNIETLLMLDPSLDATPTSNNALYTFSALQGFNGTTWDRLRNAGIGDPALQVGILASQTYVFNGTTSGSERIRAASADALATGMPASGLMVLRTVASNVWDRVQSAGDNLTSGGGSGGILGAASQLFDGTNYDVARGVSATNLTATTNTGILLTAPLSAWSVTNTPAAATQATASRAAGAAGVRHVATTVTACLAAGATAQTPVVVNLRDGATGAGTVLRSWAISAPVNDSKCADLSGLAMIGTAATAMTIEFAAAGVAASQQTVTLTGFSTN